MGKKLSEKVLQKIDLYQGDCFDIFNKFTDESVDCIICDLPYGQIAQGWDKKLHLNTLWEQYNRILKDNGYIILFSSGQFTFELFNSNPKQFKYKLIWKKNVPSGMNSVSYRPMKYYEEIMVFIKGQTHKCTYNPIMKPRENSMMYVYERYTHSCSSNNHIPNELKKLDKKYDPKLVQPSDVLDFKVVSNRQKMHPTEKPIELLEWLIKTYSNEGDIILDNCMGAGSCGLACIYTNRNFIGIELDNKYFNIAVDRIKQGKEEISLSIY